MNPLGGLNQAPGYGMVSSALGSVPIIGGILAGAVLGLMETRKNYTDWESARADRLGLEGMNALPELRGRGAALGLTPGALNREIAAMLGGGFDRDALAQDVFGGNAGGAFDFGLRASKAYGMGAGTVGQYLGMWRSGGGLARAFMHEGDPEFEMRAAMGQATNAGVGAPEMGRYLGIIAEATSRMAEQGLNLAPNVLPTLAEALRLTGGGRYAGVDLSQQFTGLRGVKAAQSFMGAVQGTGQGQGNAIQEAMLFDLFGVGEGKSYFDAAFQMQNIGQDPRGLARAMLAVAQRFREAPGDIGERWFTMTKAFPQMNPNDLMALLTAESLPSEDDIMGSLAAGAGGVEETVRRRLARQPRDFARQDATLAGKDVALLSDPGKRKAVLGLERMFHGAKSWLADNLLLKPGADIYRIFEAVTKAPEGEGLSAFMDAVMDVMTSSGSGAGSGSPLTNQGGPAATGIKVWRNILGGKNWLNNIRPAQPKKAGKDQGAMILHIEAGPGLESILRFTLGEPQQQTNLG
jgi:hypothetical protein